MYIVSPFRCCSGKEEDDFRPLFDNFVHDLLTTLSLPEWPSSEVLLTLLGVLLVRNNLFIKPLYFTIIGSSIQ